MRRRLLVLALLALAAALAGCVGNESGLESASSGTGSGGAPSPNGTLGFQDAVTAMSECTFSCYEPTVAVDSQGRIFVAEHSTWNETGPQVVHEGMGLVRSTDGGATFETVGAPPLPEAAPPTSYAFDGLVQIGPDGSLYFSAVVADWYNLAGAVYGIQVARSDDGGQTWATNTFVSIAEDHGQATVDADRQWLAFGGPGTVYLTYAHLKAPLGVFIHRSDDRGETWSDASVVANGLERGNGTGLRGGQAGNPVVDSQGTVYVPMTWSTRDSGELRSVHVAVSEDGGETWRYHEAFRAPRAGSYFPMLTVDGEGRLHLAALSGEGLMVTTSTDGARSWTDPVMWTEQDPAAAPWIEAVDGNLTVAYHEDTGNEVSLHVASRPLAAEPGSGPIDRVEVADDLPSAYTHFTHVATGPGGPWVTWADEEAGEIRVAGGGG